MSSDLHDYVELGAILCLLVCMFASFGFIFKEGVGPRTIQFTVTTLVFPTILILALEKILEGSTVGTLIGGLLGYLLSGFADGDSRKSPKPKEASAPAPPTADAPATEAAAQ